MNTPRLLPESAPTLQSTRGESIPSTLRVLSHPPYHTHSTQAAKIPTCVILSRVKPIDSLISRFNRHLSGVLPRKEKSFALGDLPLPVSIMTCVKMARRKRALLVTATPALAEQALADAETLFPNLPCLPLAPADDEAALFSGERIAHVRALLNSPTHALIVTSIHALLQPVPEPHALEAASLTFQSGQALPFEELSSRLTKAGYERVELVETPLTFAVRGGILDLWPAGAEQPIRVDFFGDNVEELRTFDPITQCSISRLECLIVPPTPRASLRTTHLLPQLQDAALLLHDAPAILATLDQMPAYFGECPNTSGFKTQITTWQAPVCWSGDPIQPNMPLLALKARPFPGVQAIAGSGTQNPEFYTTIRRQLLADLDTRARKGEHILLCVESAATQELLTRELPQDAPLFWENIALSQGFVLDDINWSVVTTCDFYPSRRIRHLFQKRNTAIHTGQRLEYAFDVEPGELVVHLEHGIGRFLGLNEIEVDGRRTEVFTLEYANGAKLHVPTSHAHLLSRYIGPGNHQVKLHALDGKRWQHDRVSAQQGIEDLAAGLLDTQARRRVMPGFSFSLTDPWLTEFEALFPWTETPDQTQAIADVKQDMAAPTAMDRLICGDAGYGKTEVAMRAAFIAVTNHKQVAVLAPTTVLAEQHYATFCERMAAFPVRIEVLSRFRTRAQRQKTREDAANGQVDILIGTHALLTENVPFRDLGLLIIDEEQRFGVAHKEQLKRLRALVDVLTMSATPIPRTLYLSLTGARDLSLLRTPPQNRVAVETILQRDEDAAVARAISKELARGGQVFYLYNRVHTIERMAQRLRRLVPNARVLIAHGQMPAAELAATMHAFELGQGDVLLCTTIVESGIDIPRANTILIDRADRFGLAELYQLRGRVGRSAVKGFAYLLLPPEGILDSDARRRLQALKRHSGLGAGYAIALRDLEIRGSGNLLGAAQSGHIAAIGFGLYCQLLRRTIARLKGEHIPNLVDVELSLDFLNTSPGASGSNAAAIPYTYIEDDAQRMNIYRRLAELVSSTELRTLQSELTDRYGALPAAAVRAFRLAGLRLLAAERNIAKVEIREHTLTCYAKLNHSPIPTLSHQPLPCIADSVHQADAILDWLEQTLHAFHS